MSRRLRAVLALLALTTGMVTVGLLAAPLPALAYEACNSASSATVSAQSADANQSIDFTATFRDCNGNAIAGANVSFAQGAAPAGCTATFTPASAKTDANGVAHTSVKLPPGCPCQYSLSATAQGVTVTATVRENGCLPFTAGAAAPVSSTGFNQGTPVLLLVVSALLLLVAGVAGRAWIARQQGRG